MRGLRLVLLLVVLALRPVWGADLQLVLTVPVETQLATAGAADTKTTWLEMLSNAKGAGDTIDLEQFYLSHKAGEPLEGVLDALREAAGSGVAVRLLVDKSFLKNESGGVTELADTDRIEIRVLDYGAVAGGVQHSKFFIVNQKDAFLGSANFDWRALKHIHETGIRTQDPHLVTSLRALFEKDWARAEKRGSFHFPEAAVDLPKIETAKAARFAASPVSDIPRGMRSTLDSILDLLKRAKKTVQIQTMDYSTGIYGEPTKRWHDLNKALIAASKVVSVQLLVDETKKKQPGLEDLKKAGVEIRSIKIPEHSGGSIPFARLIHSKYILIDGREFWIGTDNLGKSYFHASRGVGLVSSDKTVARQLSEIFSDLWSGSLAKSL